MFVRRPISLAFIIATVLILVVMIAPGGAGGEPRSPTELCAPVSPPGALSRGDDAQSALPRACYPFD